LLYEPNVLTDAGTRDPAVAPDRRVAWLRVVVAAAFAAGLLLSRRVWLIERSFPLAPVADWLPAVRPPVDWVVYVLLLALLAAIALLPRPRWLFLPFVAIAAAWCLWDQSRWQPWVYQYLFMLAALAFASGRRDSGRAELALNSCRVIVAFTYVYSGLQKLNATFFEETAVWLLEPIVGREPGRLGSLILSARVVIPFVETTVGVGLLLNQLRGIAVAAAVAMHLFILVSIGPLGHNWNSVVWPWNLAMIGAVLILFVRAPSLRVDNLLWGPPRAIFPKLVLLLFGVMPLLSFFGRWDLYLSSALYSGNVPYANVEFGEGFYQSLPEPVRNISYPWDPPDRHGVNLSNWALAELNVPVFPAERVFVRVGREVERGSTALGDSPPVLTVFGPPDPRDRSRKSWIVPLPETAPPRRPTRSPGS
jgi:hypothetical protein